MNMRLIFPLVLALALVPMLAAHNGFRPNLGVGSGYTSDWQVGRQGDASERGLRFECVAAGTEFVRRAAPAVIGGTAKSPWQQRFLGFAPGDQIVCVNS
jgi:hypothetical protein